MPESIDDVKARLRGSFLGKAGIHGFGLNRKDQAIRVYINSSAPQDQSVLTELCESARPFQVQLVDETPPRISDNR